MVSIPRGDYAELIAGKMRPATPVGFRVEPGDLHPVLFDFQRAVTAWALRLGCAAVFEECGLGKTAQQVTWASEVCLHTGSPVLIFAPLTVGQQTVAQARDLLGIEVLPILDQSEIVEPRIYITNYDRFHRFEQPNIGGVVLDESSILKSLDGKTKQSLIDAFQATPFRLACTATPAPNDITEIANHAEFLGIKTRTEMLATFFVHDADGWRLKRHATRDFYRWLASWAVYVRRPSDLGFSDEGYRLPPLDIKQAIVPCDIRPEGMLFSTGVSGGVVGRSELRHATLHERVSEVVNLVNEEPDEQWILWCGLNAESDALAYRLGDQCVQVEGNTPAFQKEARLQDFISGRTRILITKPRVCGFGMNFQHCARMAFVGLGDSFEAYYQCLRRCWRFGQQREVIAHIVISEQEDDVLRNVQRKEEEAVKMGNQILEHMGEMERANLLEATDTNVPPGILDTATGPDWTLHHGDCVEVMRDRLDPDSVDLSVYSPPFATLYTYSDNPRDMGNSSGHDQFFEQFGHFSRQLLRVTKPGRLTCLHVAQIPALLERDGYIGLHDFRGKTIDCMKANGWVHYREVCIDKDPQAQAIRTHSKALLFTQMQKDRSWSGPALADYILVFRKPGVNAVPIKDGLTNEEWIEWARPIWYGIRESDTLNVAEGRGENDERHICPLQLGVIDRCVRLWSNPGELVLSPFTGIGSEGYQSLINGRRFVGAELKPEYFRTAKTNLRRAEQMAGQASLFGGVA